MIQASEWRVGNYLLQKIHTRIVTTKCSFQHFDLMAKGEVKDLFPVILRAELFEKAGFIENKDYPLLPDARYGITSCRQLEDVHLLSFYCYCH